MEKKTGEQRCVKRISWCGSHLAYVIVAEESEEEKS